METMEILTLAVGAAWASGINLYATVLLVGSLGLFGVVDLPPGLEMLENPLVLVAAAILYCIEFLADKIPVVDTLWDTVHTFIRVPAGAMIAANAVGGLDLTGMGEETEFIAALIAGGALTAGTHATKAASRAVINVSPEPFSNIAASLIEDVLVFSGLSLALFKPVGFMIAAVIALCIFAWLAPKLWRGMRSFFGRYKDPVGAARNARARGWTAGAATAGASTGAATSTSLPASGKLLNQDDDASF